jgi:hypothetical protein
MYHSDEHLGAEPHVQLPRLEAIHRHENAPQPDASADTRTEEEEDDDNEPSTMRRLTTFFGGDASPSPAELAAKKRASMPPPPKVEPDSDWSPMRRITNMF